MLTESWQNLWQQHTRWLRTVLVARLRDQLAADVVAVGALRKRTKPGARSKSDMRYLRVAGANQIFLFFVSQKLPDHTPLRCGQHKLGNR